MKKNAVVRAGLAACICAGVAAAGATGLAAPSLARPGADIAQEQPKARIGVEDRTPTYRQDGDDAQFTIENFIMEAPDLFLNKEELTRILEEGMGEQRTMTQLRRTVDELTSYCRTHGYPAAAVYLPPQESTDGVVVLRVLPGRYDEIAIENKSRLRTPVARRIIADAQRNHGALWQSGRLVSRDGEDPLTALDPADYVNESIGEYTVRDIFEELRRPGRDPRPEFRTAHFSEDISRFEDVTVGMVLEGTVSNVAAFGAFVDIGVHQDGLIHISQMSREYVANPHDIVRSGDIVTVRVVEVDASRRRISLSLLVDEGGSGRSETTHKKTNKRS